MALYPKLVTKHSAGNTQSFPYYDGHHLPAACAADDRKIKRLCKPEDDKAKRERIKKKGGLFSRLKLPEKKSKNDASWINDHCEFLLIKPSSPEKMFEDLKNAPKELAEELGKNVLDKLSAQAEEKLTQAVQKKLAKMAIKQGLIRIGSFLLTPAVGIAVNILMTADGVNDFRKAVESFPQLQKEIEEAKKAVQKADREIEKLKNEINKYKDAKQDGGFNKQELVSDMMYGAAESNECIRARRCALVLYKQTHGVAPSQGSGCCPGQSGHHVLPSSMWGDCPSYEPSTALTICVEGTTNTHASHGAIHSNLKTILKNVKRPDGSNINPGAQMTKAQAIDAGAASVIKTFPLSGCDEDCIKAQLMDNYKGLNCKPKNEAGTSGGASKTSGNSRGNR